MTRTKRSVALLFAACALVLLWSMLGADGSHAPIAQHEADAHAAVEAPVRTEAVVHIASSPARPELLVNTAPPAPRYPHPITKEHLRLYREADLLDGAATLLRKHEIEHARVLLQQHSLEYSAREGSDNQGLWLLADCLEHRDADSVARAQAFYDRHTHSMIRRQIRKQCLE
jgi:hypothetical protein